MYISVFSNTFLTMHRLKIDDKNRELEPEWSSFQRKICTYQLSIVSTITTKKENISWFIENKIEWLVCDVFAIFFLEFYHHLGWRLFLLISSFHFAVVIRNSFLFYHLAAAATRGTFHSLISLFYVQRTFFKARRRKWILGLFVYCLHIIKAIFHSPWCKGVM